RDWSTELDPWRGVATQLDAEPLAELPHVGEGAPHPRSGGAQANLLFDPIRPARRHFLTLAWGWQRRAIARDTLECLSRGSGPLCGQIAEGNNADQALVAVQNRQTTYLKLFHVACGVLHQLIVVHVLHLRRHHLADLASVWSNTARDRFHRDIAIGQHAYEP